MRSELVAPASIPHVAGSVGDMQVISPVVPAVAVEVVNFDPGFRPDDEPVQEYLSGRFSVVGVDGLLNVPLHLLSDGKVSLVNDGFQSLPDVDVDDAILDVELVPGVSGAVDASSIDTPVFADAADVHHAVAMGVGGSPAVGDGAGRGWIHSGHRNHFTTTKEEGVS